MVHLFDKCSWFQTLRQKIKVWAYMKLPEGDIKGVLESIQKKHWMKYKKQLATAINGALI